MSVPKAPLAFLDAEDGYLVSLNQYIAVGSLSVLIMDIVDSLRDDYELVFIQKTTAMSITFLISRLSSLCFLLVSTLILVAPVQYCAKVDILAAFLFTIMRASMGALFYVRVVAVYVSNHWVKGFFVVLWLFSVAGAAIGGLSTSAARIEPTIYCVPVQVGSYWKMVITIGSESFYDLMVCAFVTYKMHHYQFGGEGMSVWRRMLSPRPRDETRLADRFLRDSQIYFVITACVKVPQIVFIIIFSLNMKSASGAQLMLVWPDTALTSILAAKVYRNMKLRRRGLFPLGATNADPTFLELDPLSRTTSIKFAQVYARSTQHACAIEDQSRRP